MNKSVFGDIEFGSKFPEVSKKQFYEGKKAVKLDELMIIKLL